MNDHIILFARTAYTNANDRFLRLRVFYATLPRVALILAENWLFVYATYK